MDFGMGIANTIMAVAEGVEVIHSTVLGLGERAGNVPMEETAMALLTLYGVDTGFKLRQAVRAGAPGGGTVRPRSGFQPAGGGRSSCSRSSPASSPAGGRTAARIIPPSCSRSVGMWSGSRRRRWCSARAAASIRSRPSCRAGRTGHRRRGHEVVMAVKEHSLRTRRC